MKTFTLKDTNIYPLDVSNAKGRFNHVATIQKGFRSFILIADKLGRQIYLNDFTTGSLKEIEDDNLWEDLWQFIQSNNILTVYSGQPNKLNIFK